MPDPVQGSPAGAAPRGLESKAAPGALRIHWPARAAQVPQTPASALPILKPRAADTFREHGPTRLRVAHATGLLDDVAGMVADYAREHGDFPESFAQRKADRELLLRLQAWDEEQTFENLVSVFKALDAAETPADARREVIGELAKRWPNLPAAWGAHYGYVPCMEDVATAVRANFDVLERLPAGFQWHESSRLIDAAFDPSHASRHESLALQLPAIVKSELSCNFFPLPPEATYIVTRDAAKQPTREWIGDAPKRLQNIAHAGSPSQMGAYVRAVLEHGAGNRLEVLGHATAVFDEMLETTFRRSGPAYRAMRACIAKFYSDVAGAKDMTDPEKLQVFQLPRSSKRLQSIILGAVISCASTTKAFAGSCTSLAGPLAETLALIWATAPRGQARLAMQQFMAWGLVGADDPAVSKMLTMDYPGAESLVEELMKAGRYSEPVALGAIESGATAQVLDEALLHCNEEGRRPILSAASNQLPAAELFYLQSRHVPDLGFRGPETFVLDKDCTAAAALSAFRQLIEHKRERALDTLRAMAIAFAGRVDMPEADKLDVLHEAAGFAIQSQLPVGLFAILDGAKEAEAQAQGAAPIGITRNLLLRFGAAEIDKAAARAKDRDGSAMFDRVDRDRRSGMFGDIAQQPAAVAPKAAPVAESKRKSKQPALPKASAADAGVGSSLVESMAKRLWGSSHVTVKGETCTVKSSWKFGGRVVKVRDSKGEVLVKGFRSDVAKDLMGRGVKLEDLVPRKK